MWRWYRNQMIDGAPLKTVIALVVGAIAVWRADDCRGRSAVILTTIAVVVGVGSVVGWRLRQQTDNDPWAPR
jgi:hypothetical protein